MTTDDRHPEPQEPQESRTPHRQLSGSESAKVEIIHSLQAMESAARTMRQALMRLWFAGDQDEPGPSSS
jgi:hypothetical protein